MTVPGAVDIIKELSEKYKSNPDVVIGAGSVVTKDIMNVWKEVIKIINEEKDIYN